MQRNSIRNDENGARENASCPKPRNCSTDNQSSRIWRNTANQRADLENEQRRQVDPFYRVEGIQFPEEQLEGASTQEVRTRIPANIVQRPELVCDFGNGDGDNGVVCRGI